MRDFQRKVAFQIKTPTDNLDGLGSQYYKKFIPSVQSEMEGITAIGKGAVEVTKKKYCWIYDKDQMII